MEVKRAVEDFLTASLGLDSASQLAGANDKGGFDKQQRPPQVTVPRGSLHTTMPATWVGSSQRPRGAVEAFSMPPGEVEVAVPKGWKPGDKVAAQGPHGRIWLDLPISCEPDTTIRYKLRPSPDLVVEVPPGAWPGSALTFERSDGTRISIEVPQGKRPGEQFEVRPPVAMVLVPDNVPVGGHVVFCVPGSAVGSPWLHAQVPSALHLGRYFAARLPPPGASRGTAMLQRPVAGKLCKATSSSICDTASKEEEVATLTVSTVASEGDHRADVDKEEEEEDFHSSDETET